MRLVGHGAVQGFAELLYSEFVPEFAGFAD